MSSRPRLRCTVNFRESPKTYLNPWNDILSSQQIWRSGFEWRVQQDWNGGVPCIFRLDSNSEGSIFTSESSWLSFPHLSNVGKWNMNDCKKISLKFDLSNWFKGISMDTQQKLLNCRRHIWRDWGEVGWERWDPQEPIQLVRNYFSFKIELFLELTKAQLAPFVIELWHKNRYMYESILGALTSKRYVFVVVDISC